MRRLKWLPILFWAFVAAACETMSPTEPGNLVPKTVAEDATLPAIEMNGARFHVQTFGDPSKPVIVFLHGGPGGDYRSLLKLGERFDGYSLADDHFLVYWDQRGSGLSERQPKEVLKLDVYLNDLNALIDRYAPGRKVFLIGESWGGMFATSYINKYPQRVAGAVLIEPGPLDGATMERLKGDIAPLELGAEWLNDYAWGNQFITAEDHARMDYARLIGMKSSQPKFHENTVNKSAVWRLGAVASRYIQEESLNDAGKFEYDFTTHLSAFTTPVLFITGSWSEVLGASLQEQQMLRYPSASLKVIEGAGHDVAWIKPAETLTNIKAYLDARTAQEGNQ